MSSALLRSTALLALLSLSACFVSDADVEAFNSPAAGMVRLGQQMRDKGEIGPAIDFYRRAMAHDPKSLPAAKGLGGVLEQWGDKTAAAEIYKQGLTYHPKDGELQRGYGRMMLALEQPDQAKQAFEAAIESDGDDMKAHSGLGVALDYLGDHKAAQKQYDIVLDSDPTNLSTLNNLAYSYILSHKFDQAIKTLEPQMKRRDMTPAMRQNLALAYGLSGLDADAERVARMDLSPEKVRANMDYYRRQRAEIAVDSVPYAEIGTYATEAMALGQVDKLRSHIEKSGGDIKPIVVPQVTAPGGTPRFTVRMMGCSKPDDVSRLCETLAASKIPCVTR